MYVFSSFEHSTHLDLAISELEESGIENKKILAVTLDKKIYRKGFFDNIHYSDGISTFDTASVLSTLLMVLGVIYGYVLRWGPIIWGLIGMVGGFAIGLVFEFIPKGKSKINKLQNKKSTEVILVINCEKSQLDEVERILIRNFAIGVGTYEDKGKKVS